MNRYTTTLFAAVLIVGCGTDADPEPPPVDEQQTETVFDPMTTSLERARAVDDLAKKRKSDIDKQLEEATTGAPPE